MVKRRVHHKRVRKRLPKERKAPPKKKIAVVVGTAYTIEQLQALIADLSSGNSDREISGISEFAENQGAVSEVASKVPEFSGTDIMELVIAAVRNNELKMLLMFEKERKVKALRFVAKSSSVPPQIQEKAKTTLQKIEPKAPKVEKEEPTLIKVPYTVQEVKVLIRNLESKVKEIKISAVINFIKDYPRIAPTVAKMPMLTVTQVTIKAVEAIKQNADVVINTMVMKNMRSALIFLSSLAQVPLEIRKKAQEAVQKLGPILPREEKPKEFPAEKIKLRKQYTPFQLEALLSGLDSVHRVRAVKMAVEFLKNYDIITKLISKTPMLSVTEVTAKAVNVIENNLNAVLNELVKGKEKKALEFLAQSSKFSMNTQKKAAQMLKQLIPVFSEDNK
jgi:hypothetical protein